MGRKLNWPPSIHTDRFGFDYIRVTLQGRRRDFRLGPKDSPESRRRYRQLLADLATGLDPSGRRAPNLTVAVVCAQWVASAPARYAADSREPEEFRRAVSPLVKLYGDAPAAEFGPKALKAVRRAMTDSGISRRVANRRVTRLKTLFKWAAEEEMVPGPVYQSLRAVRALPPGAPGVAERPPVPAATWDQVKRVYRRCSRTAGAMFLFQWFTGCRSQDVRLLRACDLDRAGDVWLYRPWRHKNRWRGHERVVAVGPRAQAVLGRWLRLAPSATAYLFDPRHERRGRARKDHYTDSAYGLAVGRAAGRAGVTLRCYSARHGYKLAALRLTGDRPAVQAAMGQKSSAAFDGYGGVDVEAAAAVARRVG